jgi:hypothetical protein
MARWRGPRLSAAVTVVAVAALLTVGCSSGDDAASPTVTADVDADADDAVVVPADATDPADAPADDDRVPDVGEPAGPGTTTDDGRDGPVDAGENLDPIPEIGVPGLDSEVVVCRAWSRFAGSFQVVAVAASFGDDPLEAARLEVVASPVVTAAVDDMVANWPDELADEADAVADDFVGPYGRRSALALEALVAAGADPDDLDALADAWVDALAARDPADVLPNLELSDDLADLVETAAADFAGRAVPIPRDPSLVTEVEIPRSEEFLFETCPDRGTLGGTEIPG